MMKATQQRKDGNTRIELSGSIDERDDFRQIIGSPTGKVVINGKYISQINSQGCKAWISYFAELSQAGVELHFEELSPVLVESYNMFRNFLARGKLESIMLPFLCSSCQATLVSSFTIPEVKSLRFRIPDQKCHTCGSVAIFDDVAGDYFAFLKA